MKRRRPGSSPSRLVAILGVALACGSEPAGPSNEGPGPFASLTGRGTHTCGVTLQGAVYCWGANGGGVLGTDTTEDKLIPEKVAMPAGLSLASLSAGGYSTCGLTPGGLAYCWGVNQVGQLGDGTRVPRLTPTAVAMPAGVTFTSVSASIPYYMADAFACGLTPGGEAYCWGGNDQGQLGDGSRAPQHTPALVPVPAGVSFTILVTGAGHGCGLTPAGTVYCWGDNDEGQLGDGTLTDRLTPVAISLPPGVTFGGLSAGGHHTCGLTGAGAGYCWGFNAGRIGDGTATDRRLTPTAVAMAPGVTLTSIVAGYNHTCALNLVGEAYCWGRNSWGQVGDGTSGAGRYEPTAVRMPPGQRFTALTAGWMYSCGLTPSGAAYCWGLNSQGQLGDGTTTNRSEPVKVGPD